MKWSACMWVMKMSSMSKLGWMVRRAEATPWPVSRRTVRPWSLMRMPELFFPAGGQAAPEPRTVHCMGSSWGVRDQGAGWGWVGE